MRKEMERGHTEHEDIQNQNHKPENSAASTVFPRIAMRVCRNSLLSQSEGNKEEIEEE